MTQTAVHVTSMLSTRYTYCCTCAHRRWRVFSPARCAASDNDQCQLVNAFNTCKRWAPRSKR